MRKIDWLLVALAALAVLLCLVLTLPQLLKGTVLESRARGMIGRPISEVVEAIGAPTGVIAREDVESGKNPFPPTGWTLERARAVTASVYLYLDVPRGDYVCLFVDDGGILIDVVRAYS
ncbi:MAG: hypothetical protein AB1725_09205 [Armatimonadota bacterium]